MISLFSYRDSGLARGKLHNRSSRYDSEGTCEQGPNVCNGSLALNGSCPTVAYRPEGRIPLGITTVSRSMPYGTKLMHTDTSLSTRIWQRGMHVSQLDGVRGLAILIVTLYRFGREMPTESWLGYLLSLQLRAGERGVELFFVLSGFLITGILVDAKSSSHYFRNFFARRGLRIFPLYFASLVLFLWLIPAVASLSQTSHPFDAAQSQQFYLWTYLTNVHMSLENSWCFGSLDHFWSLAVEEHFYLIWPFIVFGFRERTTLWIAAVGGCLATCARFGWLAMDMPATAASVLTLFRCDGLLLGATLALLIRSSSGLEPWRAAIRWSWLPLLMAALMLECSDRRVLMLGSTLWTLAWGAMLASLITTQPGRLLSRFFDLRWLRGLGQISYAMYVFQNPLIPLMAPLVAWLGVYQFAGGGVAAHCLYILLMFATTCGLAWVSWHAFEKHWLRLKGLFATRSGERVDSTSGECALVPIDARWARR